MQVSEAEVEAYLEREAAGSDGAADGADGAVDAPGHAPSASPPSGAKPPPLPKRRGLPRLKPIHFVGFLALCVVLGLGIGVVWNLAFAPEPERGAAPAAAETGAQQAEGAEVEIRLDEMVVTSDEQDEQDEQPGAAAQDGEKAP